MVVLYSYIDLIKSVAVDDKRTFLGTESSQAEIMLASQVAEMCLPCYCMPLCGIPTMLASQWDLPSS